VLVFVWGVYGVGVFLILFDLVGWFVLVVGLFVVLLASLDSLGFFSWAVFGCFLTALFCGHMTCAGFVGTLIVSISCTRIFCTRSG